MGSNNKTMTGSSLPTRFKDETVLVTGSTRGIGRGIARRFAKEGANVVVTGRSVDDGEDLTAELRNWGDSLFVRADVREPADIERLVDRTLSEFDRVDVLVNNAGVETETSVSEATIEDWDLVLETDFRSFWLCARKVAPHMPTGSSIINMSSNHAFLTMPGMFPYNAVKAGINGMTRAMALDFGPQIRVNTINPGWIAIERTVTDMTDQEQASLASIHPTGRLGTPEDVAGAVAFLASDDAAFVTGTSLLVDGGRSAVMQDDTLPDYRSQLSKKEY